MAELLQGWKRTHYCAEPTVDEVGKEMVLMGWAGTWRNLGSLIFIGLRDRTGTMQVTFNESELPKEVFEKAETIRSEYVIAVKGVLARRDEKMVNRNMKTGELELIAKELKILGVSETPPFYIDDNVNAAEQLRLKYRYLDLRRPCMQANMLMRSKITKDSPRVLRRAGFHRDRDSYPLQEHPRGRPRLSGTQPRTARQVLRSAPEPPDIQAAAHAFRL